MRGKTIAILLLTAAMSTPVGLATWFTPGSYEPDTKCDDLDGCVLPKFNGGNGLTLAGGYMFISPPDSQTTGLRVYFNGYAQSAGTANPNNEVLGSHHLPTGSLIQSAWLGVWKDCNEDGYIGAAQGAADIYSSALGVNTAVCADGSVFNKGGWVYEFQWIGNGNMMAGEGSGNYPAADDKRWINDTEAYVWADWDLPGQVAAGSSCPISPFPYGTTSGTGGAIQYVDCILSRRIANQINDGFAQAGLGTCFADPARPERSNCVVNQRLPINLFGNPYGGADATQCDWQTGLLEYNSKADSTDCTYNPDKDYNPDTDNRAFDVWDCSERQAVQDHEGNTLFTTGKPDPTVNDDPLHSSWYDGLNATERGTYGAQHFVLSDVTGISGNGLLGTGHTTCANDETSNVWWVYTPGVEGNRGTSDGGAGLGRSVTDTPFVFSLNGALGHNKVRATSPLDANEEVFHEDDVGTDTAALRNQTLGQGYQAPGLDSAVTTRPNWGGQVHWLNTGITISRATLQPSSGRYMTYYASIGAATTSIGAVTAKGNAASLYGNEWCNGNFVTDTVVDGFNCIRARWWTDADSPEDPTLANGIDVTRRAGDPYHVRDIDCYDGEVARGTNVHASLADFSPTGPCVDSAN